MKFPIYLDHNATTPMDPRVLDAMLPYFTAKFGNAASRNHPFGWEAEDAVETAREQAANAIGADAKEIIWTSGATESNNIAIKGVAEMYAERGNHIITVVSEHKATIDPAKYLEGKGFNVTFLPVDREGLVDLNLLRDTITEKTILVSIMHGNNEIGTLQPIEQIGALIKEKNPDCLFHTDATQTFGKLAIDVNQAKIDLLSASAHKIYGPKGVGMLYVRRKKPRVRAHPVLHGGGHERGMRSGTLNVPGIVGFGKATELCVNERAQNTQHYLRLRDRLKAQLFEQLDETYLNGHATERLPNNLNVSFNYVEGEGLMMRMKNIAVSSGSACTSASLEPSYVLKSLGVGEELAHSSIRFGIGRFNTEEEIDYTAKCVIDAVKTLREMSPLYEMAKEGIDLSTVQWAHH